MDTASGVGTSGFGASGIGVSRSGTAPAGFCNVTDGDGGKAHRAQRFVPVRVHHQIPAGIHPLHLARACAEEEEARLVDLLVAKTLRRPRTERAAAAENQREPRAVRVFTCRGSARRASTMKDLLGHVVALDSQQGEFDARARDRDRVCSSGRWDRFAESARPVRDSAAAFPARTPQRSSASRWPLSTSTHTPHSPARMRGTISARAGESVIVRERRAIELA